MKRLRVLVVGDICLDRWCTYDPIYSEPSRETGLARTAVIRTEVTPGAGGTIANNLRALGVEEVSVLGVIGDDGFGWELSRALELRGVRPNLIVDNEISTFTYTKLLNSQTGAEDLGRVDFINIDPPPQTAESEMLRRLVVDDFDVVIACDQAETPAGGVITESVRDRINGLAGAHSEKIFWVDSRIRIERFRNVVAKPNESEADAACKRLFETIDYSRLREHCHFPALIVTQADRGAQVIEPHGSSWVPTRKVPVRDICGAGDSFSAAAACALAVTRDPVIAAEFGNLAASVTVQKPGTGVATPDELLA